MAKSLNPGKFSPSVEVPDAGTPAPVEGLSPELLQQVMAAGISPEILIQQLQAQQQGATQAVAPVVNPLEDLERGGVAPQPISPFLDPAGQQPPANAPQPVVPDLQSTPEGVNILTDQGTVGTTADLRQAQIDQFNTEEAERARGAIGFNQSTRQQFDEAYSEALAPGKIGDLHRLGRVVSDASIEGRYKIKDSLGILPENATPVELVSKGLKASPVEAVNATTFAFLKMSNALSARQKILDEGGEDPADTDEILSLAEIDALLTRSEGGRVAIEADTLDGILAGYTKSTLDRVRNADSGPTNQPKLVGNAQAKMLINSGLLEETFFQPENPKGEIINPDSVPIKGYQVTERGAMVAYELKELSDYNKREYSEEAGYSPQSESKAINQPFPRRNAVKVHGKTPGTSVGAYNLSKPKAKKKAAGEKSNQNTAIYQYAEDYRQSPARMNPRVITAAEKYVEYFKQARSIKEAGGTLTPQQNRLLENITKFMKLERVPSDAPGSPSKLMAAERAIQGAKMVDGFMLRHVEQHGNLLRLTNQTANLNEQEYPRVHKGAMEGRPQNYVFTDLKIKSPKEPVISQSDFADYKRWVNSNGDTPPSINIKRTAMLIGLGSWIVPGSRINTTEFLVENFTMGKLREFGEKGDVLQRFVNDPAALKEEEFISKLNDFIETDISIDKGKINGFIAKASFVAGDIIKALDNASLSEPISLNFSPVAPSGDMSSAGLTLMAFDKGDFETISHVGLMYTPDGTLMFEKGNPRKMLLGEITSGLKLNPKTILGISSSQQAELAEALTPRFNSEEGDAGFADDFGKGALMVSGYGKSRFFMQPQAKSFLEKYPAVAEVFDRVAAESDNYDSGVALANEAIGYGLQRINKSWYAQMLKNQATAAMLLGFNLSGNLSDGSKLRVGVKEHTPLKDSGYEFKNPEGEVVTTGDLFNPIPSDSPRARSPLKWDKDTESYAKKRIGSSQINTVTVLQGIPREVEVNAIAHKRVQARLQDPNIYFGNIHDNIMGDPEYMALFQHEVKAALKQVTKHDLQKTIIDSFEENAQKVLRRIKAMDSEIVIGASSKDPALSGWIEYLDEVYAEYKENLLKDSNYESFKWSNARTEKLLRKAYRGGEGIWKPLGKPGVTQSIGGTVLEERQPSETVAMVVSRDTLLKFISSELMFPLQETIRSKNKTDLYTRPKLFNETFEFLENNEQGWMKIGRP